MQQSSATEKSEEIAPAHYRYSSREPQHLINRLNFIIILCGLKLPGTSNQLSEKNMKTDC